MLLCTCVGHGTAQHGGAIYINLSTVICIIDPPESTDLKGQMDEKKMCPAWHFLTNQADTE